MNDIATLLLQSQAAPLAWRLIRDIPGLRGIPPAQELQEAYRFYALQATLHQRDLKQVIPLLRSVGVEPVLVKGWAIARLYPETGLRPYSDLDLCVPADQHAAARKVLNGPEGRAYNVDLHLGFGKFYERRTDDVLARSELVRLDDLDVRVLSAEDHLRFLGLHLLRHGVVRPLWLCDIAVALEMRTEGFDWDVCLGGSRRQADWVACAIGLAHQLLGANVDATPVARRARALPSWLAPTVLKAWGTPLRSPGQIGTYLRHPRLLWGLLRELPRHWPNPIEATMTVGGPLNALPRLPFQIGHVFSRAVALASELPGARRASSS